MQTIIDGYNIWSRDPSDAKFSIFGKTLPTTNQFFRHVPLTVTDPKERKILSYSEAGFKNFYPWFISDHNAAEHIGVIGNFLQLVPTLRSMIEKHQYPFFRLDESLYKIYTQVELVFFLSLFQVESHLSIPL